MVNRKLSLLLNNIVTPKFPEKVYFFCTLCINFIGIERIGLEIIIFL